MELPAGWTGPSHVLHEPWMQQWFRDDLAALIRELEDSGAPGLDGKRRAFRQQGLIDNGSAKSQQQPPVVRQEQAMAALLNQRIELLVGAQLSRAGVLTRMRDDSPDFEVQWGSTEFGVEVTTRARPEAAQALQGVLERGLWDGPDVLVTLRRSGTPLFSLPPEKIAEIGNRVVTEITERVAEGGDQAVSGTVPAPELELSADFQAAPDVSWPGQRVSYQSLLGDDESDHHWKMAAKMIKDTIEKEKADTDYSLPSILVLDISRLGNAGKMPPGVRSVADLFTGAKKEPWTTEFQAELNKCNLGKLKGVLIVRSNLRSQTIEPLCWRGEESPATSAAVQAVCLGDKMPTAPAPPLS